MTPEAYLDLFAQVKAQDMILRILFAESCMRHPNPRSSAQNAIESTIASLTRLASQEGEASAQFAHLIEDALREFSANIDARLAGEGYQT